MVDIVCGRVEWQLAVSNWLVERSSFEAFLGECPRAVITVRYVGEGILVEFANQRFLNFQTSWQLTTAFQWSAEHERWSSV